MAKNIEFKPSNRSLIKPIMPESKSQLAPNKPYAVLDVGSTKTAVAILNMDEMDENSQLVYGYATNKTKGITKGKVTNLDHLSNTISETLKKALNSSEVTVSWLVNKTEGENITHTPEIGVRLVLPRTEKKLQVVVENKTKEINNILQENKVESGQPSSGKEDKGVLTASMRYIIQQKEDWNIYSEGGIKVKVPLQPFAGVTGGRVFTLDKKWTLDTKAQLVWYLDDGLSEVTTANIDYLISIEN